MARGFSLFEEALLVFEAPKHRMVHKGCSSCSECNPVLPCHYDETKRSTTQTSLDHFFKRVDRIESSKEPEPVPSTSGMSEISACPPSPIVDDPSALPPPTSSPFQSVTLLDCSLDASPCMPAVVLY